jgi:BMFP domain-containing protein YqiC
MVQFNKKNNHQLLKEVELVDKEHQEVRKKIIKNLDENTELETKLNELENTYKEIIAILKDRL